MGKKKKKSWNERYREGGHHDTQEPSQLLKRWISSLPSGKALDVGCGAGRNSLFLSEHGYLVDAVDFSEEALKIAKNRAEENNLEVNWIQKDIMEYEFPNEVYDVIIISFFHPLDKLGEIKNSLKKGGYFLYQHHINTKDDIDRGPKKSKFRYNPNELLKKFRNFQILEYREGIETYENGENQQLRELLQEKRENSKQICHL